MMPLRLKLMFGNLVWSAFVLLAVMLLSTPALAAADGLPRLDRTNGGAGTDYTIVMAGSSVTMDPALVSSAFTSRGTLTIFQDPGTAELDADLQLDMNGDSILDRSFNCSGYVGMKRFALRCSENDGFGDFRLLANGNVLTLDSGKIALRKASGHGFTETTRLRFSFKATEQ